MWTCFKFCPKTFSENYKPVGVWFLACLQIYRELLSLVTFFRVHSISEKISYLSWQNTYPNLKTSCYIKLKFLLRTKLQENLLLAKYLISVAASLNINNSRTTSENSINPDRIRKLMKYSLKTNHLKAMFTLTVFEILLFEC